MYFSFGNDKLVCLEFIDLVIDFDCTIYFNYKYEGNNEKVRRYKNVLKK